MAEGSAPAEKQAAVAGPRPKASCINESVAPPADAAAAAAAPAAALSASAAAAPVLPSKPLAASQLDLSDSVLKLAPDHKLLLKHSLVSWAAANHASIAVTGAARISFGVGEAACGVDDAGLAGFIGDLMGPFLRRNVYRYRLQDVPGASHAQTYIARYLGGETLQKPRHYLHKALAPPACFASLPGKANPDDAAFWAGIAAQAADSAVFEYAADMEASVLADPTAPLAPCGEETVARRTRRGTAAAAATTPGKVAAAMEAEASAVASTAPCNAGAGAPLKPAAAALAAQAVHCPYLVGKRPPRAWNMGLLDADNDLLRAMMPW